MLNQGLDLVQSLGESCLLRLKRLHLVEKAIKPAGQIIREGTGHGPKDGALRLFICTAFYKGGNIPGNGLAPVVDQTHVHHPVHVQLREFILQQKRHNRQTPAVLCYALPPAGGGPVMAGIAF